ncbi:ankyrin repeat-containing protein 27 [Elsinoe australis]|uniref:Ankyrin repeat-containing protein 27 n=1 Tax=Elsinoe australis TaxID=40998 RepID=A0A4U7APG9_9PEZI|nr:ankyrin repeat-containing protein 27 [Elsinoe australis]
MPSKDAPSGHNISGNTASDGSTSLNGILNNVNINNTTINQDQDSSRSSSVSARERLRRARRNLLSTDPAQDRGNLLVIKGERVRDTCTWIRQSLQYQGWLQGNIRTLWIYGGPGKGKTMLSIFMSEDLENSVTRDDRKTLVIYYFCANDDEKRNTACMVLRAIIWRMVKESDDLLSLVQGVFEDKGVEETLSSKVALWQLLITVLSKATFSRLYLLIDGLDECKDPPSYLESNLRKLTLDETRLQLCIVSQKEPPAHRGYHTILLDRDLSDPTKTNSDAHVKRDLQRFIADRVRGLRCVRDLGEKQVEQLGKDLLLRSEGTFLWAGFAMLELRDKLTYTDVTDALRSLPKDLPSYYNRMLSDIDDAHVSICSQILRLIVVSLRPLTISELINALSIRSGLELTKQITLDRVKSCGSLLELENNHVRLVHSSAKDFLLQTKGISEPPLSQFRMDYEAAHLEMAEDCISVLASSALNDESFDLNEWRDDTRYPGSQTLLPYAIKFWPEHMKCCPTRASDLLTHDSNFFHDDSRLCANWLKVFTRTKRNVYSSPSLLLASSLGIVPWMEAILNRRPPLHRVFPDPMKVKNKDGYSALHVAALTGQVEATQLLLDRKMDPNVKDEWNRTPLFFAEQFGHKQVATMLIQKGGCIESGQSKRRSKGEDSRHDRKVSS